MKPNRENPLLSGIKPWTSLWERDAGDAADAQTTAPTPEARTGESQPPDPARKARTRPLGLNKTSLSVAHDLFAYPFDMSTPRLERLEATGREFGAAKSKLEAKGLIRVVSIGRAKYLVPTPELYEAFGVERPSMKRDLSLEHSFAVRLAAHLVRHQPLVSQVETEVAIGTSGATVDLVARRRDGTRLAYEVTLGLGNLLSHAVKCQGQGFAAVVFLCRDTEIKNAAQARLRDAGLPQELYDRCRTVLFSALVRVKKKLHGE